jgi:hypothetical protein
MPSADILRALAPITNQWVRGDKVLFTITRQEPYAITLTTEEGYVYGIEPSKVFVEFQHQLRIQPTSAGLPIATLLSEALPFTKLLPNVSERAIATTIRIAGNEGNITRVGVVSTTTLALEDAPPGIARFISYIGRPWNGQIDFYSFQISATIDETSDWSDKCIHFITVPDNPELLPTLKFDWQRTYTRSHPATQDSLETLLSQAQTAANDYFEEVAEGDRFDEELLRGRS